MANGQRLLDHILASVEPLVTPGVTVPGVGTKRQDLGVVASALLRKAYLQASAVALLARSAAPEAGIPNVRSLAEAAGELNFLFEGDSDEKAQIAFGFALKEIRDFYRKFGEDDDQEDLKRVEGDLAAKALAAPAIYAKVESLRNYWVETGRAKLVDAAIEGLFAKAGAEAPNSLGHRLYKVLSWDEHHVMATLLSIDIDASSPGFGTVVRQNAPKDPQDLLPAIAAMLLNGMSKTYRRRILSDESPDGETAT